MSKKDIIADDCLCPKCGKKMVVKLSRFGKFLACPAYPECKTTENIHINEDGTLSIRPEELVDGTCERCGESLATKYGPFGPFTACRKYPKCKFTDTDEIDVKCPRDGHLLVERRSRRGRLFYGCGSYPDCDFVVWKRPVNVPCPKCGNPYLFRKKDGDRPLFCDNGDCDYLETSK